jgi:hypothetical protein
LLKANWELLIYFLASITLSIILVVEITNNLKISNFMKQVLINGISIVFVFVLFSCKGDPLFRTKVNVINGINGTVILDAYSGNTMFVSYELSYLEKIVIYEGEDKGDGITFGNNSIRKTDSVIITFPDGKKKTDRFDERRVGSGNFFSGFASQRYRETSCGKYCRELTYTIDEKDYAEAK